MTSPVPFAQWGLDFVGELPKAPGQLRYILVAVDYFSKWVEAEPMSAPTAGRVVGFVRKNIICRYGMPVSIVTDNGPQFRASTFQEFCAANGIQLKFTSVAHPQANGQTEIVNKVVQKALKKKLDDRKGAWAEELPYVIWGFRTTYRVSTGHTPFELVYGSECRLPLEVDIPSPRMRQFSFEDNSEQMMIALDLLDEIRTDASIHADAYKKAVAKIHDKKVRNRQFHPGHLVLRRAEASAPQLAAGKFGVNWEGPYRVEAAYPSGSYELSDMEGNRIPRRWHASNLMRFHPREG